MGVGCGRGYARWSSSRSRRRPRTAGRVLWHPASAAGGAGLRRRELKAELARDRGPRRHFA